MLGSGRGRGIAGVGWGRSGGVVAECCDCRLHSLHRAVGVAVCGLEQEGAVVAEKERTARVWRFTPG